MTRIRLAADSTSVDISSYLFGNRIVSAEGLVHLTACHFRACRCCLSPNRNLYFQTTNASEVPPLSGRWHES
jgi:hypothetical protein